MNRTAILAVILFCGFVFYETEPISSGVRVESNPSVYRMWKDENFPVPKTKWEAVGFTVHDYNHSTAYKLVKSKGYGHIWNRLPHYSSKSDLFRYVVIFTYGGWYADADVEPNDGITLLGKTRDTVFFNEACGSIGLNKLKYRLGLSTITHSPQYKSCLFSLPQKSPVLKFALEKIIHTSRIPQPWSIPQVIDYTGPGLLTDAVEARQNIKNATLIGCKDQEAYFYHKGMRTWHK